MTRKLWDRLEELGAAVTEMDYSVLTPYRINSPLERALEKVSAYAWVVLTSPNGVEVFFDYLKQMKLDVRNLLGLQFAVISTGTAAALEKRGIYVSYMPERMKPVHRHIILMVLPRGPSVKSKDHGI